ncbi:MAG TPA: SDR family oxidoreductase [Actinomycetota bacterium]|nr:SDR family oxidoreductase [Actinomycetota bacterium]
MSTRVDAERSVTDGPLSGAAAIVTGGARGLGAATTRELVAAGARVAVLDVRDELAEALVAELPEGSARRFRADLTDDDRIGRVCAEVEDTFGSIDVLVNNAGVDMTVSLTELSVEDWDRIVAVNLRAPALMSRAVWPAMRRAGGGRIVNIVSTAAKRAWANAAAYHASKWGLLGLSHALHVEGRDDGIVVSAVVAGGMRTPFLFERFPDLDPDVLQEPAAVARAVRFVLESPPGTVVPEMMVLPTRESSWP